jgi:hypothetical protein
MARCYQLTEEQSRAWDEGGWLSIELEEEVIEWADRHHVREPVIVVTRTHTIAFALTAHGVRAEPPWGGTVRPFPRGVADVPNGRQLSRLSRQGGPPSPYHGLRVPGLYRLRRTVPEAGAVWPVRRAVSR